MWSFSWGGKGRNHENMTWVGTRMIRTRHPIVGFGGERSGTFHTEWTGSTHWAGSSWKKRKKAGMAEERWTRRMEADESLEGVGERTADHAELLTLFYGSGHRQPWRKVFSREVTLLFIILIRLLYKGWSIKGRKWKPHVELGSWFAALAMKILRSSQ